MIESAPSVPPSPRASHEPVPGVHLTSVLDDLDAFVTAHGRRPATLAEIEAAMRGRGAGILVLVLAAPFILPIPIPFLATAFALPIIVMGLRMLFVRHPHLPTFARRREVGPEALARIARGLRRLLTPVAKLFRPRIAAMFWAVPWRLTALGIVLAAAVLALPLPIPLANMLPALALVHYAAGLIQRDGLAILFGHAIALGSVAYLLLIGEAVRAALAGVFA